MRSPIRGSGQGHSPSGATSRTRRSPLIETLREYWASEVVELSSAALAHQQRSPNGG